MRAASFPLALPLLLVTALLTGCAPARPEGPIDVGVIDDGEQYGRYDPRLSPMEQALLAASSEGLVTLDAAGQVVPALAERWIVTNDGLSYIFRLHERNWRDGESINASDVAAALTRLLQDYEGSSLGLDLAKIAEVRAMTDRIVELRLASPMPQLLQLLAQPELGIRRRGSGAGPMIAGATDEIGLIRLSALSNEERGLPGERTESEAERSMRVREVPAQAGVAAFSRGEIDVLLNGRLASLPQVELGPLSRGTVQLDPALGLMGFIVRPEEGLLAEPGRREAISMAIDRAGLVAPFNLGGWRTTSWIVPPSLFERRQIEPDRWSDLSLEDRRALAASRIAAWVQNGDSDTDPEAEAREPRLDVLLPPGPGSDLLFARLAQDWGTIGVAARRVSDESEADLVWHDRLARYSSPRWFLNQLNCQLELGLCSPTADELVRTALTLQDPIAKEEAFAQAHAILVEEEVFIPLGAPVRWALVRGAVDAYLPNVWGLHPLFPLAVPTT